MSDSTQAITYQIGTHRVRSPAETLKSYSPYMPAMGITRIADVTGLDNIGIPVVMVYRPNARSVSVSQGKGNSVDAAKASGLMESIEAFHAEHIHLPVKIGSFKELHSSIAFADVASLPKAQHSPFDEHYSVTWIEGQELYSGQSLWLPYEMVHTNYTLPRLYGSGCFPASSNGLASGNTLHEALVHAMCELIERDALSIWSCYGTDTIDSVSIDLNSIDSSYCVNTLNTLHEADQSVFVWDITTDIQIPTYIAVIQDKQQPGKHIGVGSGTHLSREVALLRALHEAVQVRTTYIVGARDDLQDSEYTMEGIAQKHSYYDRIIQWSTFKSSFGRTQDKHALNIETDQSTLLECLEAVGVEQVLSIDLTKSEFGIPVVRVVIPGLESPHDDEGYVAGHRAVHWHQHLSV